MSDPINELAGALALAQAEFPAIPRSKTVQVRTRTGGNYTFNYAPLEAIIAATRPALSKHGLSVMQDIRDGHVCTILAHKSGQIAVMAAIKIEAVQEYKSGPNGEAVLQPPTPQDIGSALTYARRYSYSLALCISADDDDDVGAAAGNETKTFKEPLPAPPELLAAATEAAKGGLASYKAFYFGLEVSERKDLLTEHEKLKNMAAMVGP